MGMSPDQYRAALKRLNLSQSAAGRFVGVKALTGRRWAQTGPTHSVAMLFCVMIVHGITPDQVRRDLEEMGVEGE